MNAFPFFELRGEPDEIGTTAGRLFGDRIRANYEFYEELFAEVLKIDRNNSAAMTRLRDAIVQHASTFETAVRTEFPKYDAEIQAMAKAAELPLWKLYTLNARTEVYRLLVKDRAKLMPSECTSLFFPKGCILGQTWDWHPALEDLTIVTRITSPERRSLVMLTEPGIIGKIGLNSRGVGVCLNILFAECELKGVPVHILLRGILDSDSYSDAIALVERTALGTVSNLLIADAGGSAADLELIVNEIRQVCLPGGELLHTNHYLADETQASAAVPGSVYRLARPKELYQECSNSGLSGMKRVLSDRSNPDFPICRSYSQGIDFLVGTVAAVVMDLPNRTLFVAKGQPTVDSTWTEYTAP